MAENEQVAGHEMRLARTSLEASELARMSEALAASAAWMKSLHSQLLAKTEAIAARDVELVRANLSLDVLDETLARMGQELDARKAELGHMNEALAARNAELAARNAELSRLTAREAELLAMYASTSWRITAPIRDASRAARWFTRGLRAWLTVRPGSRPRRVARRLRLMLFPADNSPMDLQNNRNQETPAGSSTAPTALVRDNHSEGAAANTSSAPIQDVVPENRNEDRPKNTSSRHVQSVGPDNHNAQNLELSPSARLTYTDLKTAITKRAQRR